jgi:hypothetical protein
LTNLDIRGNGSNWLIGIIVAGTINSGSTRSVRVVRTLLLTVDLNEVPSPVVPATTATSVSEE